MKSCEIPREFELIAGQGHTRSSILVSIESTYVTSYKSQTVTLDISPTVFKILTFKDRKWIVLHPSLVSWPRLVDQLQFWDET